MSFIGVFAAIYLLYMLLFVVVDVSAYVVVWQTYITKDLLRRYVSARSDSVLSKSDINRGANESETLPTSTFISSTFREKFVNEAFGDKSVRSFDNDMERCDELRRLLNASVMPITRKKNNAAASFSLRMRNQTLTSADDQVSAVQSATDVVDVPQIVLNHFPSFVICAFTRSYYR